MNTQQENNTKQLPLLPGLLVTSAITAILGEEPDSVRGRDNTIDLDDLNQTPAYVEWVLAVDESGDKITLRVILDFRDSAIYYYHSNDYNLPISTIRQLHGLSIMYPVLPYVINFDEEEEDDTAEVAVADTPIAKHLH
jgi:hypothetical protein